MENILIPPEFLTSVKNKHLLLDTNFFRDVTAKPVIYLDFVDRLKKQGVTLITNDLVKYELLKGSASLEKYNSKEKMINDIVDASISVSTQSCSQIYELIKKYGIEGTAVSITDLFLGATLMQYKKNIYLMTRDTTDFIQRIFELLWIINVPYSKGIFTYGIYQYR